MQLMATLKSLSYIARRQPYPLEKPTVIQFPVIDICNSRCQMCRIWENKHSDDITADKLRVGLRNPLYGEVRGVGLNGGEPTLRKDLADLTRVLYEELPKLSYISLITNAFKADEVIQRITEIGEVIRDNGGLLDVMVSIDGVGDVHDRVRGKPGNFARALKVIEFARKSDLVANVRIGCTIIRENVYGLHDLLDWCRKEELYIKYRLGVPHQRLYTATLRDPYALTFEERYHVVEFLEGLITHYESGEAQKFFYRSLIGQLVHNQPRTAGCDWQHRGATITAAGELLYCAVQSKSLGVIDQIDSEKVFFGNAPHLAEIRSNHCDDCHHDYVGLPSRTQQIRQLTKRAMDAGRLTPQLHRIVAFSPVRRLRSKRQLDLRRAALAPLIQKAPTRNHHYDAIGPRKVMICGWYGTETLGDKAILGGLVQLMTNQLGPINLTVVTLFRYITDMTREQMPELGGATIVSPEEAIGLAHTQDLIAFGGGPIMAIRDLADMEAIFAAARKAIVPTLIGACGIGPIGDLTYQKQIKRILDLADARIYRDRNSLDTAQRLGIDVTDDLVAEDPAFSWLATQPRMPRAREESNGKVLLLGLREFPWREYAAHLSPADGQAIAAKFEMATLEAIEEISREYPDLIVRPLPMCTNHFGADDRFFYRRLFLNASEQLHSKLDMSLLSREFSPVEYVEAFRAADAMICMRFHSLVFALALGVPSIVLDYTLKHGKVSALADRFDLPVQSVDEIESKFVVQSVRQLLMNPPSAISCKPILGAKLALAFERLGIRATAALPD